MANKTTGKTTASSWWEERSKILASLRKPAKARTKKVKAKKVTKTKKVGKTKKSIKAKKAGKKRKAARARKRR